MLGVLKINKTDGRVSKIPIKPLYNFFLSFWIKLFRRFKVNQISHVLCFSLTLENVLAIFAYFPTNFWSYFPTDNCKKTVNIFRNLTRTCNFHQTVLIPVVRHMFNVHIFCSLFYRHRYMSGFMMYAFTRTVFHMLGMCYF